MGLPRWMCASLDALLQQTRPQAGGSLAPVPRRFTSSATPLGSLRWNPRLRATL